MKIVVLDGYGLNPGDLSVLSVVNVISFFIHSYYVNKVIEYKVVQQLRDILPFFFIALITSSIVFLISLLNMPQWAIMLLQLFIGAILTIAVYQFIYRCDEFNDIKSAVLKIFGRK